MACLGAEGPFKTGAAVLYWGPRKDPNLESYAHRHKSTCRMKRTWTCPFPCRPWHIWYFRSQTLLSNQRLQHPSQSAVSLVFIHLFFTCQFGRCSLPCGLVSWAGGKKHCLEALNRYTSLSIRMSVSSNTPSQHTAKACAVSSGAYLRKLSSMQS